MPFFSIVVPVYNVEKYLVECIESLIGQTYKDFEIILINDGSTDSSSEICNKYEKLDDRIRVINQKNKGLFMARKVGLEYAKGKYIVHVDSDDSCSNNLLKILKESIEKCQADVIIYNCNLVNEKSELINSREAVYPNGTMFESKEEIDSVLYKIVKETVLNNLVLKCAKKDLYDIKEDYSQWSDVMMGEDIIYTLPLIVNAKKIVYIDECLYNYRIHSEGMSQVIKKNYIMDFLKVRTCMYYYLLRRNSNNLMNVFFNRYVYAVSNYLMKLSCICDNKYEYTDMYYNVIKSDIHNCVLKNWRSVDLKNRIIFGMCSPRMYRVLYLFAKKILMRKKAKN